MFMLALFLFAGFVSQLALWLFTMLEGPPSSKLDEFAVRLPALIAGFVGGIYVFGRLAELYRKVRAYLSNNLG